MSLPEFILGIITQGVIVVVAWLGLRGKLADLGKGLKSVQKTADDTKKAAVKTESSINNRDSPASDRWDAIHSEVKGVREILDRHTSELNSVRDEGNITNRELIIMGGQVRGVRDEVIKLKEDDEQTRIVVREAISERDRSLNQLRGEIPRIIERELRNRGQSN